MKKILTLALALIMMLSLAVCVSAAEETYETGTNAAGSNNTITAEVTDKEATYYVNIAWDSLAFTYTGSEWNPLTHKYEGGTWSAPVNVKITNHSNVDISYDATLESSEAVNGVIPALSGNTSANLISGDNVAFENASNNYFQVAVSGVPTEADDVFEITKVVVTING